MQHLSRQELTVILILGIWFFGAVGTVFTKDSQCMGAALLFTVLFGIGYAIIYH